MHFNIQPDRESLSATSLFALRETNFYLFARDDGWLIVFHSWKLRTLLFYPTVDHMTSMLEGVKCEGVGRGRGGRGERGGAENKKPVSVMFLPLQP